MEREVMKLRYSYKNTLPYLFLFLKLDSFVIFTLWKKSKNTISEGIKSSLWKWWKQMKYHEIRDSLKTCNIP